MALFNNLKLSLTINYNNFYKVFLRNYTARRALLYVPGDDTKKLNKSLTLDADCIVMDCEDGVAQNRKIEARNSIKSLLNRGKPPKKRPYDLSVRINSINSGLFHDDLREILSAKTLPDTVLLPKVQEPSDIDSFSDEINRLILTGNKINLIVYIESALGFINLVDICRKATDLNRNNPKFELVGLVFGSDDFCANIGVQRSDNSIEILYARQKLVLIAKAFNLQAIDMVHIKYQDLDGLKRNCIEGVRMGYTGKQIIHPGQIEIVQNAFLPTRKQYEWARGILEAFEEHQKTGKGAFNYQGDMIDMPTMKQAENIVNLMKLVA